jgi:general secretion pathway protein D
VPESRPYTFPKNWVELSKKRSPAAKMTAKEREIMKALSTTISVEFEKNSLEDVVGFLKRVTGVEILVDRRALEEASVSYETPVTLKTKLSMRTVLKRVLADLNLTYVIKDEAIQITSRERAKEMTTTRTYYIGDLAMVTDFTVPLGLTQVAMLENVNRIINMITQNTDQQSWKVNNPDAVGTIVFNPLLMSITVKQTAEVHFMLGGYR